MKKIVTMVSNGFLFSNDARGVLGRMAVKIDRTGVSLENDKNKATDIITQYENTPDTYFIHIQFNAVKLVFNAGKLKSIEFILTGKVFSRAVVNS